jgi:hypothetical protein
MSNETSPNLPLAARGTELEQALAHIRNQLKDLRYGTLLIVVQDGVVVQIERTEKTRLPR